MRSPLEIDELVAEHVMGFKKEEGSTHWHQHKIGVSRTLGPLPPFSSNVAAAWEVVERMFDLGFVSSTNSTPVESACAFAKNTDVYSAKAPGLPLAICLAALKAKGIEV